MTTSHRIGRSLLAWALLASPGEFTGQTDVPAGQQPTPGCSTSRPLPPIPANAEQIASTIEVLPLVQRVRALASECSPAGVVPLEELTARQQIGEAVQVASLGLQSVLAEIDYERAQLTEFEGRLLSVRERKATVLTLASILIGSGSGIVGTSMQFSGPLANTGNWITAIGGAGSVVLSILALRQHGGGGTLGVAPNMLAPIFGRTPEPRSVYPPGVWTYLNTVPATDPRVHVPWKDELIAEWIRLRRIGPPDAPESQRKLDQLTTRISEREGVPIDLLSDRSSMLMDLRSRLSLMVRDLRDLLKAVSIPPAQSTPASPQQL